MGKGNEAMVSLHARSAERRGEMEISEDRIIDKIEVVRRQNNGNWMELLRIALKSNPIETKAVLRRIAACDSEIQNLLKSLGE